MATGRRMSRSRDLTRRVLSCSTDHQENSAGAIAETPPASITDRSSETPFGLSTCRTSPVTHQDDQAVGQRAPPIEVVVAAIELLIVDFVTLREQHVAHVTTRLEDRAAVA